MEVHMSPLGFPFFVCLPHWNIRSKYVEPPHPHLVRVLSMGNVLVWHLVGFKPRLWLSHREPCAWRGIAGSIILLFVFASRPIDEASLYEV